MPFSNQINDLFKGFFITFLATIFIELGRWLLSRVNKTFGNKLVINSVLFLLPLLFLLPAYYLTPHITIPIWVLFLSLYISIVFIHFRMKRNILFPRLHLLFRLNKNKKLEIIIPSYINLRYEIRSENQKEKKEDENCIIDPHTGKKIINYPMFPFEAAYDDVFCNFSILPSFESYFQTRNIECLFDKTLPDSFHFTNTNLILIGSSYSNKFTKNFLLKTKAYYQFGYKENSEDEHDICFPRSDSDFNPIDITPPIHALSEKNDVGSNELENHFVKDYGMISCFLNPNDSSNSKIKKRVVVLAGCRAFGQVGIGILLHNIKTVEILCRIIPENMEFQCIVEFSVNKRSPYFEKIVDLIIRNGNVESEWKRIPFPEDVRDDVRNKIYESAKNDFDNFSRCHGNN